MRRTGVRCGFGSWRRRKRSPGAAGTQPVRDLHWERDGAGLGVVQGRETGSLHLVGSDGKMTLAGTQQPVRRFAGWNANGQQLAYVVPEWECPKPEEARAFVLTPDPKPE